MMTFGQQNVGAEERVPRVALALAVGAVALWARGTALKAALLALAGGMLSTVATGYCPVNALADRDTTDAPEWRTIKTWRVEASPSVG